MTAVLEEHSVRVELRGEFSERRRQPDRRAEWTHVDAIRFAKERYNRAVAEWEIHVMAFWSAYLDSLERA